MKPAIVLALAFVGALGLSTGVKVMMTKPAAKATSDSTKTDSTKTDSTKTDSAKTSRNSTPTDTAVVASGASTNLPADTAHTGAVDSVKAKIPRATVAQAGMPAGSSAGTAVRAPASVPAGSVPPDTIERRIARVFTSMDPAQAAKVLGHMSDGDVQIILGYVGVRQAAAIMAALPPERVAILSKLAMKGPNR